MTNEEAPPGGKHVIDENKRPSFYELIAKDEGNFFCLYFVFLQFCSPLISFPETLKIFSNIVNSMTANVEKLTVSFRFEITVLEILTSSVEVLIYVGQIQTSVGA
jgi:hypothetical protein